MKNPFTHTSDDEPCEHMVGFLNNAADKRGSRFGRLYAVAHAARCGGCGRFLNALEANLDRLKASKADSPSPEVSARLNEQLKRVSSEAGSSTPNDGA